MTDKPSPRLWKAVGCNRFCDAGYRGMDNCNACGCTGSQLLHLESGDRYPNTEDGWSQMVKVHPEAEADTHD